MKEEIWKDIEGYDQRFAISDVGRVKNKLTENLLSTNYRDKEGARCIKLNFEGKRYRKKLYTLLAETFLPNPENLPFVDFKNGDKDDVALDNLKWISAQELANKRVVTLEEKYGDLVVLEDLSVEGSRSNRKVKCRCSCGKVGDYLFTELNKGKRVHCGCKRKLPKIKPLDIDKVNEGWREKESKHTLLEEVFSERREKRIYRSVKVLCNDCGTISVKSYDELNKHLERCGQCRINEPGISYHPLYSRLAGIKSRCYNENNKDYPRYGGRGIKVCDEWLGSAESFIEWGEANGFLEELQIDRINNDGDYEPSNCRWITQLKNTRRQPQHKLDMEKAKYIRESSKSNRELAKQFGVHEASIKAVRKGQTWV